MLTSRPTFHQVTHFRVTKKVNSKLLVLRPFQKHSSDSSIWRKFQNIWQRLNTVKAPGIWVKTIHLLSSATPSLNLKSMIESPQTQLDLDRRVYRRPVMVDMLLQILTCLLTAGKSPFSRQIRAMASNGVDTFNCAPVSASSKSYRCTGESESTTH